MPEMGTSELALELLGWSGVGEFGGPIGHCCVVDQDLMGMGWDEGENDVKQGMGGRTWIGIPKDLMVSAALRIDSPEVKSS